jgi:hypothetical protein
MEEWVVVETRRMWPAAWRTEQQERRFAFLESGAVMLVQRQRAPEETAVQPGRRRGAKDELGPRRRRRRSRVEVGKWWFDIAGLRWDVTRKRCPFGSGGAAPVARQYSAAHHVNVFGARPRLVCGMITQDRPTPLSSIPPRAAAGQESAEFGARGQRGVSTAAALVTGPGASRQPLAWLELPPWALRPVVGTFVGRGDSADTHDSEYAKREVW